MRSLLDILSARTICLHETIFLCLFLGDYQWFSLPFDSSQRLSMALTPITPYNVGSVLWRLFSTLEVVQYIGGITSVLWGIASVLWRLFSTVGG